MISKRGEVRARRLIAGLQITLATTRCLENYPLALELVMR
jgi:hypothetical protein